MADIPLLPNIGPAAATTVVDIAVLVHAMASVAWDGLLITGCGFSCVAFLYFAGRLFLRLQHDMEHLCDRGLKRALKGFLGLLGIGVVLGLVVAIVARATLLAFNSVGGGHE